MVLLDIGLLDIEGYALCRRIKELDTSGMIQVIFVTGYTDVQHETDGFEAGSVDYIAKPVSRPVRCPDLPSACVREFRCTDIAILIHIKPA
jgi:putative two-component system response regulator